MRIVALTLFVWLAVRHRFPAYVALATTSAAPPATASPNK